MFAVLVAIVECVVSVVSSMCVALDVFVVTRVFVVRVMCVMLVVFVVVCLLWLSCFL